MEQIHDKGYKKSFSNKIIFRQLIETFVKEGWVKDLDFENCETIDKTFISEHYKETEEFLRIFEKEEDKQAVSLFLNWFKQLSEHDRIERMDYNELEQIYKSGKEVKAMLITALEKETL
jgi:hypothetical protein